ncbi:histone deacetylase 8-like [Eurosta solidaginis]|uniref:histone deacetylase 8-like n=1 Tax=Eurosta solidaginis TaxID=178769 RepID=UPI0035308FB1
MQQRNIIYVHSERLIQQADKNPAVRGRAALTHRLIASYGLLKHMQRLEPKMCQPANLRNFHNCDYVQQLLEKEKVTTLKSSNESLRLNNTDLEEEKQSDAEDEEDDDYNLDSTLTHKEYGLGFDCPSWRGMWEYACTIAGGTMSACAALCKFSSANKSKQTVTINWTGGWHHAKRDRAAGYCYVNDIVLGILIMRKHFMRVLYIDLDVHHGDGVQQAFEVTKRVFTFSMHRYECGFYPGTGGSEDCGFGGSKGYAANFPFRNGIGGGNYCKSFKRIVSKIFDCYAPDACVIQCGADAIVGDPLGGTNLTSLDFIDCIGFVLERGLPTVLLGGGGYNFANASRFWTQLTASCCGRQISEDIPTDNHDFLKYGPDYSLKIPASNVMKDENSMEYLEQRAQIIEGNLQKYNVCAV